MTSQRLIIITMAALALLVGMGMSWWRLKPHAPQHQAVAQLFAQRYLNTTGGIQPLSDWRGKWLVVNFWAPWCAPCVEEMPGLQQVRDEYVHRNLEILGIGIDSAERIQTFAQAHSIRFPLYAAGPAGIELAQHLGNPTRALPYTVLITPTGEVAQHKLGQIQPQDLRDWLTAQHLRP